jgi:superfamily II DNA or RNA helicase
MKKAVLSNRIILNRTKELHDMFSKELTYHLPSKRPGVPGEIICDVTRINKNILSIPIGRVDLIPEDYEIVDKRLIIPASFPAFKFKLREDQQEVYDVVDDNTIIQANPSWGKTFTGISLATKLRQKTLIITHTKNLFEQWIHEVKKTLGITPGVIGAGKYDIDSPIVIGLVQTLRNRMNKLTNSFGAIIVDECHHVPATVFKGIVDAFKARYKIGLTATPWRKDGQHVNLWNYFGGEQAKIITKDNNKIDPIIILVDSDIELSSNHLMPWATRVNALYDNPRYMELILNLTQIQAEKGHLVLTLADRVEFLQQCHDLMEDESMLVVGGVEDRDFLASKKRILFGTGKIYSEGVNIPPLSSLIMGMPINNRGLLEQLLGRISRIHEGKKQPEAIDIMLKGKTGKNQAIARINYYAEQNLKIVKI